TPRASNCRIRTLWFTSARTKTATPRRPTCSCRPTARTNTATPGPLARRDAGFQEKPAPVAKTSWVMSWTGSAKTKTTHPLRHGQSPDRGWGQGGNPGAARRGCARSQGPAAPLRHGAAGRCTLAVYRRPYARYCHVIFILPVFPDAPPPAGRAGAGACTGASAGAVATRGGAGPGMEVSHLRLLHRLDRPSARGWFPGPGRRCPRHRAHTPETGHARRVRVMP